MSTKNNLPASSYTYLFAATLLTIAAGALIFLEPLPTLITLLLLASAFSFSIKSSASLYKRKTQNIFKDLNKQIDSLEKNELVQSYDAQTGDLITRLHDLVQKNARLTVQSKQLQNVFENVPSGLILVGNDAKTVSFNKPAKSLLNLSDAKKTKTLESINVKQIKDLANEAISGKHAQKKIQFSHNQKTIEARAIPFQKKTNNKFKFLGGLITLQDTTRVDALADVKKDFVANVSHDLRTPITSIRSLTEALLAGAKDDPQTLERFLNELDQQSERLSSLARDILDLSKIENKNTLTKEKLAIGPLLKQSVKAMEHQAEAKKIALELNIKDRPQAKIDAEQLIKAFNNLLDNSIKYTPANGTVSVSLAANNGHVKISVKDTGIGISQKSLPRIFERFYRVSKSRSIKSGGTGLGLSIVKHVIENHNGEVSVKSQLGKGSEFIITLPK